MPRFLKIVLGVFGLVVVLALVVVAMILLLVDPADYRDDIAQAIEQETGRQASIEGDISLKFFPAIGLEVGRMTLGNPPGFGAEPFAEIDGAAVGARVMPLLSGRLEVSTLRLDGLRLGLVKRADGSANWESLGGAREERAARAERRPEPPAGERGSAGLRFAGIDGLELRNVALRYEDGGTGQVIEAGIPRLSTGKLAPGEPFSVDAEATLALDEGKTRLRAELALTALAAAAGGAQVELSDLRLRVDAAGEGVPGGAQEARITMPGLTFDGARQALDIPALALEVAGLRVALEARGESLFDAPVFNGQLTVREFSPRELLQALGAAAPPTRDPEALRRAALQSGWRFGGGELALDELRASLDQSTLSGRLALAPGEVTRVRGQLELDGIDLDRYLAPEAEGAAAEAEPQDAPLAFEWLRGLDLDLGLRAGRLVVAGLQLAPVETRATAAGGRLQLRPLSAGLYQGQASGSAVLDARSAPAAFRLQQSVQAVQVQPLVTGLADFARLTGTARLDADLATTAASSAGLLSGLNGTLGFDLSDGKFLGINLWYEIQRAYALARGRAAPEKSSPDTDFRQLRGTAVIRDGKLRSDDLVGGLQFLALAGRGEIDLAAGTLDYRLTATVMREAVDEVTGERSELAGARIPLRLSGELASPSVSVDVAELLKDKAVDELKERAKDPLRKLRERLLPEG